jgi:hypothetical protein
MNEVAVIVRFHGGADPALLDEALFSLCLQGGVRVRPIIVLHNVATHVATKLQRSLLSMPSDWAHPGRHEFLKVASKSLQPQAVAEFRIVQNTIMVSITQLARNCSNRTI